jgi:fimbrial chaperone protein
MTSSQQRRRASYGLLAAALLLGGTIRLVSASSYGVNPTQVVLSAATSSRLVTLRNDGAEPLRFQITTFKWDQTPQGEMRLEPTRDIVVFPSLLTVDPGKTRTIRVGFTGAVGTTEATYRIFVEELPPDSPAGANGGIRMLTRTGIPVFIQPKQPAGKAQLSQLRLDGSQVSFALRNIGNVHMLPQRIRVRGLDKLGAVTVDQDVPGWYVLAGGVRNYEVPIPTGSCAALASLSATVEVGGTTLQERLTAPCPR